MSLKRGRPPNPVKRGTLGFHIRRARLKSGIGIEDLARQIGVTHPTISQIETGKTKKPAERTLRALATELKSDFGLPWLRKYAQQSSRDIPILARVAGGRPIERMVVDETISIGSEFARIAGTLVAVIIEGDSMVDDHVVDGDRLVCRHIEDPKQIRKDAMVIVRLRGEFGEGALKRWRIKGQDKQAVFTLSSDHNDPNAEKFSYPIWKFAEAFEPVGLIRRLT